METLSPLQQRLKGYQPLISHKIPGPQAEENDENCDSTNETENEAPMIRSLCDVAIRLCNVGNYIGAQHVLNDALYGPQKKICYKYSLYWILQSEISEELGNIQDCLNFFNCAAKYKSQVCIKSIILYLFYIIFVFFFQ